jgi:hypothetical protein
MWKFRTRVATTSASVWLLAVVAALTVTTVTRTSASALSSSSAGGGRLRGGSYLPGTADDDDDERLDYGKQSYSLGGDTELETAAKSSEMSTLRRDRLKKLLLMALIEQLEADRNDVRRLTVDAVSEQPSPATYADDDNERYPGQQLLQKRGRWQGFCFRRTRSGRILPYICWKGSDI